MQKAPPGATTDLRTAKESTATNIRAANTEKGTTNDDKISFGYHSPCSNHPLTVLELQ